MPLPGIADTEEKTSSSRCLTHASGDTSPLTPAEMNERIRRLSAITKPTLPLEEEIRLLEELNQFDLGRFLLRNQGINGYWTAYWLLHGPRRDLPNPLEHWLIHRAPAFQASRERFGIFQKQLQNQLPSQKTLASIPCGVMDDLLRLDYTATPDVTLIGIDLDPDSLHLAAENATNLKPSLTPIFLQKDAMALGISNEFNVIASNGLNFYEPDDERVVALYQNFYNALLPGGTLITSFLTPSPAMSPESPWKNFDPAAAQKQKALFSDILDMRWQVFRTEKQTLAQLEGVGFISIRLIYDSQGMFPTVIAQKI